MKFYPENEIVPEKRQSEAFLIRPLQVSDVELDFQAVISSREKLLKRTAGRWPKPGFTIKENLADLEYHEQQHKKRIEFTFTIMNVMETECLGCIYIHPLVKVLKSSISENDITSLDISDYEAWITFWVTPIAAEQQLDKKVIEELQNWFSKEWAFSKVTLSFGPRPSTHELELVEKAGLKERYSFQTDEGSLIAWELH
ncbi:MAG: hypothetical protein JSW11_13475 [Candidatus Heimdallarchaeota archaeon]|nr:MAG: hypothetical protein JSW11_13475 [Candidatus Heimdallarchaeota archaeon]